MQRSETGIWGEYGSRKCFQWAPSQGLMTQSSTHRHFLLMTQWGRDLQVSFRESKWKSLEGGGSQASIVSDGKG